MTKTVLFAGIVLTIVAQSAPARAWWFEDDGRSWPVFAFHEYDGSDVNRPGGTPDRPYWHGDDAVPLGLRWQDLEAAQAAAASETVTVSAGVEVAAAAHTVRYRPHHVRRHRVLARRPAPICVPAPVAAR